jgi:hypothetical protein
MTVITKSTFVAFVLLALMGRSPAQQKANRSPAQAEAPKTQLGSEDITGLPEGRGIYYRAAAGWVALQFTVLMPFPVHKGLDLLKGPTQAEMPGAHAHVQILNDRRPIFYLRGIPSDQLCLVRAISKYDYRELPMPISDNFREWAHFRAEDIANIALAELGSNVVSVKPLADLKSGEYALASIIGPDGRFIRLGYDFGLTAARTGN